MGLCISKDKLITKKIHNNKGVLIYDGQVIKEDNKYIRNNIGIEYINNKLSFRGHWKDDMKWGQGVLYYQSGNIYFEGKFYRDQFFEGKEYYNNIGNTIKYIGKYTNNLYDDINAKLYYNSGDIKFFGHMKDNNFIEGQLYDIDRVLIYHGAFKNNLYHNKGVLYDNKYKYEGNFLNGKLHGYCIISFNNKIIFKGEFIDDNKIEGEEYKDNKLIYKGKFKNDKYDNFGTLYDYINNTIYIGSFKSGLRHNSGKIYNLIDNTLIFSGNFQDDVKNSLGSFYHKNGNVLLYGHFINNVACGICTEYDINQKIISHGLYKDNKLVKSIKI